jgi:hypothetical protein
MLIYLILINIVTILLFKILNFIYKSSNLQSVYRFIINYCQVFIPYS